MNYKDYIKKNNKKNFNILNIIVIIIIIVIIGFILVPLIFKKDGIKLNEKITYKVKINSNGSNTSTKTLSCFTYTDKCKVNLPVIKRDGYEILGFSNKDNSYDIIYNSGEQIEIDSDMELYVITKKEVILSLVNMNDNSISSLKCNLYNNDINCQIKLPNESSNLIFQGWSDEIGSKKADYLPNQTIYLDNDKRIYAIYFKEVVVTLVNNKTNSLSCNLKDSNCEVELPNDKEIIGWSYDKNSNNPEYKGGTKIKVDHNITLYAIKENKITLNIYKISNYNCNKYNNSYCTIKLPTYNNVLGYSKKYNGNIDYKNGEEIKLFNDTVIYPIYNNINYTITIIENGSNVGASKINCNGNCNLPKIIREGYEIIGYNLNPNDKTFLYKSGQTISVNANITLYAITRKIINISFEGSNSKSCYIYNKQKECSITIPNISGINGWSISKSSNSIMYYPNKTYNFSFSLKLYPVTNKLLRATFIVDGKKYERTCTLNGVGCTVEAPVINNLTGKLILGYSYDENREIECLAGKKCFIIDDSTFYVSKKDGYRYIDSYDTVTIGKSSIDVQKKCSYTDNINDVKQAYNFFPNLFSDVKITFLTNDDYVKLYGTDSAGATVILERGNYSFSYIDINCEAYKSYKHSSEVVVHELVHLYDKITYFNKNGILLSNTNLVNNLYNKYKVISNRPMRDYAYTDKVEFLAEMGMWYYKKHYLKESVDLPDDIENYVVQNLRKNVE